MKIKQDGIGIGKNLKRLRKGAGYSQSKLVIELQLLGIDISCDIYKKMERNKYNIRVCELIALQQIYKVSFDEFFRDIEINDLNLK